jgi:hypothetical protein
MAVDWKFISEKEGSRRRGYVPDAAASQSGVTIAGGVDLGARSKEEIQAMPLTDVLKAKLLPYAGYKQQAAIAMLAEHPLEITDEEVTELDRVVREPLVRTLRNLYNKAVSQKTGLKSFDDLPDQMQTVITSVAFQYGANLEKRTPRFWAALCSQDWEVCAHELENFGDHYQTRRLSEAKLLRSALSKPTVA